MNDNKEAKSLTVLEGFRSQPRMFGVRYIRNIIRNIQNSLGNFLKPRTTSSSSAATTLKFATMAGSGFTCSHNDLLVVKGYIGFKV